MNPRCTIVPMPLRTCGWHRYLLATNPSRVPALVPKPSLMRADTTSRCCHLFNQWKCSLCFIRKQDHFRCLHATYSPADDLLQTLAARKTALELNVMRKACAIAAQAYDRGSLALAPGLTEFEVAQHFQPTLFASSIAESDARYGGQVWCRALIQPRPTSATRAAEAGGWSAVSTTMRCGGSNGKWM